MIRGDSWHGFREGDSDKTPRYDVAVVGCGIVGLAVARALAEQRPGISLLLVDKEDRVGMHQTGHSSGVIHSGLYYKPGSLKAKLAVAGAREMYEFCAEAGVPHERSGKVVVATDPSQVPALDELERRGTLNGLSGLRRLGPDEIGEFEPEATGVDALHVPEAGVTDFAEVARHVAAELTTNGADIRLGQGVTAIQRSVEGVSLSTNQDTYETRFLVNCAGLQCDRVAALDGVVTGMAIVPFRGEYYRLDAASAELVRALIYPVPDPRFPFLGVHFTRRINGEVEVGPNAVLAFGREHYRGVRPNWGDIRSMVGYSGFWRLVGRNVVPGTKEMINSRSRSQYARLARRLVPALPKGALVPGGAGVRAQAVDSRGRLVDDFAIVSTDSTVHVLNAPSPGGTASLAIGRHIAGAVGEMLNGSGSASA